MLENNMPVQFAKETFENLIFLPVNLNGIAVTAMFDTGAQMSFITESLVKQLGNLAAKSTLKGGNNQGAEATFETRSIDRFQIGNRQLSAQEMGVLPDEALDFGEDTKQNRFPAKMLLGWDIISQFSWEFDMNAKTVTVNIGGTMPYSNHLSWNVFPVVTITHAASDFTVGFDSGHTETFLDNTWSERLHDLKASETMVQGVGSARTEQVKIAENLCFSIGKTKINLSNIEISNHGVYGATTDSICGLLGADILQGTKWILDYKSRHFEIIA